MGVPFFKDNTNMLPLAIISVVVSMYYLGIQHVMQDVNTVCFDSIGVHRVSDASTLEPAHVFHVAMRECITVSNHVKSMSEGRRKLLQDAQHLSD